MNREVEQEIRQARQRLLNAVAHELNTPLTPVLIHLRRLQEQSRAQDPSMQESFTVVARNIERLIQRVKDMIRVAQLDSERFPVNIRTIALDPIVAQVVQEYQAAAGAAGLRLQHIQKTDANVHGDPDRLAEVLSNLIDNAIKYTPRGGQIRVTTDDNTVYARVRVQDTGIGFDPDDRGKLFRPFTQLETGLPYAFQGAGLGLFISKGIVELHGGKLSASSPGRGQGATFSMKLHIAKGTGLLPGTSLDNSKREVEFNKRVENLI